MNTQAQAQQPAGGRPAAHGGPAAFAQYFGGSSLGYGPVDPAPVKVPSCSRNGGLFTGEAFASGAGYAAVPVLPEADYMTNVNLRSANPPPEALYQYASFTRPGNNHVEQPGVGAYSERHRIACIKEVKPAAPCVCANECDCQSCYFPQGPVAAKADGWTGHALYYK